MARMAIFAYLDEAREHVTVELDEGETPLGHIKLDVEATAGHISRMAELRAQLADEVPRDLDPGSRLTIEFNPAWRTGRFSSPEPGTIGLVLRHPGFGWLSFGLPPHEAVALGKSLPKHAQPSSTSAD